MSRLRNGYRRYKLLIDTGRRTLYVWGLFVLAILVLIVGFLALAPNARSADNINVPISWATGSMILVFTGYVNIFELKKVLLMTRQNLQFHSWPGLLFFGRRDTIYPSQTEDCCPSP